MKVLILGASGGIGGALVKALCQRGDIESLIGTYLNSKPVFEHEKINLQALDISNEDAVIEFAQKIDSIDWVINAVGFLSDEKQQPEKTIATFNADKLARAINTNTLPTLLLAKALKPALKKSESAVFATISAKVGSITDNGLGGWYSYRISKAALNMALKTLSIEWRRALPHCTVAALHPGTTDTALSKPFQKNVPEHKLFSSEQTANYLLAVLDQLDPTKTGKFWSWDGTEIPW